MSIPNPATIARAAILLKLKAELKAVEDQHRAALHVGDVTDANDYHHIANGIKRSMVIVEALS